MLGRGNCHCNKHYLVVPRNYILDVHIDFFDLALVPPSNLGQIPSSPIRIITEIFLNKQRGSVPICDDMPASKVMCNVIYKKYVERFLLIFAFSSPMLKTWKMLMILPISPGLGFSVVKQSE
jgi:hypothetical protein